MGTLLTQNIPPPTLPQIRDLGVWHTLVYNKPCEMSQIGDLGVFFVPLSLCPFFVFWRGVPGWTVDPPGPAVTCVGNQ